MEQEWQWSIAQFCPARMCLQLNGVSRTMAAFAPFVHMRATLRDAMQMREFPKFCKQSYRNLSIIPQELHGKRLNNHILAFAAIHNCPLLMRMMDMSIPLAEYAASDNAQIVNLELDCDERDITYYLIGYMHFPNVIETCIRAQRTTLSSYAAQQLFLGAIDSGLRRELAPLFDFLKNDVRVEYLAKYKSLQDFIRATSWDFGLPVQMITELQKAGIYNDGLDRVDVSIIRHSAYDTPEFQQQLAKLEVTLNMHQFGSSETTRMSEIYMNAVLNRDMRAFRAINERMPQPFKKWLPFHSYLTYVEYERDFDMISSRIGLKRVVLLSSFIDLITFLDNIIFPTCDDFVKFIELSFDGNLSKKSIKSLLQHANWYYGRAGVACVQRAMRERK